MTTTVPFGFNNGFSNGFGFPGNAGCPTPAFWGYPTPSTSFNPWFFTSQPSGFFPAPTYFNGFNTPNPFNAHSNPFTAFFPEAFFVNPGVSPSFGMNPTNSTPWNPGFYGFNPFTAFGGPAAFAPWTNTGSWNTTPWSNWAPTTNPWNASFPTTFPNFPNSTTNWSTNPYWGASSTFNPFTTPANNGFAGANGRNFATGNWGPNPFTTMSNGSNGAPFTSTPSTPWGASPYGVVGGMTNSGVVTTEKTVVGHCCREAA